LPINGHRRDACATLPAGRLEPRPPDRAGRWNCLLQGRGRVKPGETLQLVAPQHGTENGHEPGPRHIRLLERHENGEWEVELSGGDDHDTLTRFGFAPLPPYIKRAAGAGDRTSDLARYQTVFARHAGSIAAPTAGLHFTPDLFDRLKARGVRKTFVTLHVGVGTFKPVTATRVEDHTMEPERYSIDADAAERIGVFERRREKEASTGPRLVAVGTTACRTLETLARRDRESPDSPLKAQSGVAGLFIYPSFPFQLVDALITNFHLPRGTPLMLTCAFAGRELVLHAYETAKKEGYRFYSYGDAMLIL
ncbi:MAG: S-adenosylmethionine:tRNA ribosyltransferase-isomerase, partial [Planctomycetota bacterium]|nr:S-adenosylmethionine:tRNA ribosyltransferase-isomerase [Planctomycetota bacterium]